LSESARILSANLESWERLYNATITKVAPSTVAANSTLPAGEVGDPDALWCLRNGGTWSGGYCYGSLAMIQALITAPANDVAVQPAKRCVTYYTYDSDGNETFSVTSCSPAEISAILANHTSQ